LLRRRMAARQYAPGLAGIALPPVAAVRRCPGCLHREHIEQHHRRFPARHPACLRRFVDRGGGAPRRRKAARMDQGHLREPGHDMPVSGAVMTVALLRAALVGLAIVSMPVERAFAEPVLRPDLADRVSGREDVTFADLVRLVVPGTAGNETIDVREI